MEALTNLSAEAVPCDNYNVCGNAAPNETANYDWSRGFENGERVVVCPDCEGGF